VEYLPLNSSFVVVVGYFVVVDYLVILGLVTPMINSLFTVASSRGQVPEATKIIPRWGCNPPSILGIGA